MKKQNQIRKTIVCFLILLSIGFLTNCEKENSTELKMNEFVNPMEFVGEVHNQGLEFIQKNYDYNLSSKDLKDQVCKLSSNFVAHYAGNKFIYNSSVDYIDFGNAVVDFIDRNDITAIKETPFIDHERSMFFYNELTCLISNNINLESYLLFDKVHVLEYKINYSSLPEGDKYLLLAICSVGKYSYQYWSDYLEANQYKNYSNSNKRSLKGDLINADIEGSFAGAITGGIIGAIWGSVLMPGVGTITAAIVEGVHGGVYGAIIGSGIRLLRELV